MAEKKTRIKRVTAEESKLRRQRYRKDHPRIVIGKHHQRWKQLKNDYACKCDQEVACMLLDKWYGGHPETCIEASRDGTPLSHINIDRCCYKVKYGDDRSCEEAFITELKHGSQFMAKLYELWNEQKICDATISLGDKKIHVHKLVLLANCPNAMEYYLCDQKGLSTFDIKLPSHSIQESSVKDFVEYLYTGKLVITTKNVNAIKKIGKLLQIEELVEYCHIFKETKDPRPSTQLRWENDSEPNSTEPDVYKNHEATESICGLDGWGTSGSTGIISTNVEQLINSEPLSHGGIQSECQSDRIPSLMMTCDSEKYPPFVNKNNNSHIVIACENQITTPLEFDKVKEGSSGNNVCNPGLSDVTVKQEPESMECSDSEFSTNFDLPSGHLPQPSAEKTLYTSKSQDQFSLISQHTHAQNENINQQSENGAPNKVVIFIKQEADNKQTLNSGIIPQTTAALQNPIPVSNLVAAQQLPPNIGVIKQETDNKQTQKAVIQTSAAQQYLTPVSNLVSTQQLPQSQVPIFMPFTQTMPLLTGNNVQTVANASLSRGGRVLSPTVIPGAPRMLLLLPNNVKLLPNVAVPAELTKNSTSK